jgi:citrate lyase subunit beta/citryl-CoA lyase
MLSTRSRGGPVRPIAKIKAAKMRSLLFVPGDSLRKFEKARQTEADVLILDLEDSVAPDRKDEARAITREMLERDRGAQEIYVRVNALDTGATLGDLASTLPGRPDGFMLPKCEQADDVVRVSFWLDGLEAAYGLPVGAAHVIAIVTETARALLRLDGYAQAGPRLAGLMWGAEDLAASLGATANSDEHGFASPFRLARDLCLIAAKAAGVTAIDTVYTRIDDLAGLAKEAQAARRDGFTAKAVIHPKHVEAVNAAFAPTAAEIAWAREVTDAFAADKGTGVVKIGGKMIDKPHLRAARSILASARACSPLLGED